MSTILHRLAAWAETDPKSAAQRYKAGKEWVPISAKEFLDRVYWLALFLESRGVTSQDVGTIFSFNSPEWVHLDLGTVLLGAKSAGIYPNSVYKDISYILKHTEAKFFCVQNKEYYKRSIEGGPLPSHIEFVIAMDGDTSISPKAISYEKAVAEGKKLGSQKGVKSYSQYLQKLDPNAGSFIIYTSGTTGNPKGALISQDNLIYTIDLVTKHWDLPFKGSLFSFLPLCHIAEKLQNVGAGISRQYTVNFCSKFENLGHELPEVEPSLLLCVPRLWEKMMQGVLLRVNGSPIPKKYLAKWALDTGAYIADLKYSGRSPSVSEWIKFQAADRLVLSKIRKALGLAKTDACASGAAALPVHVCRWFRSIGLEILEDFGQTETTGVICMTEKEVDSAGTVGKPVGNIEMKIARDGEILTKGRHVFKGYYKDEMNTAQTFENDWLKTGDLGEFDSRGLLRIKGRKKELLKTSGGKLVAPLPIEEALKAAPAIGQVCMVGEGRRFLSALITLSETRMAELKTGGKGDFAQITITDPEIVREIKLHVERLNSQLASFEQIKKFVVLSRDFSIVDGEMTPTMKMKRDVIEKRYVDVINKMYE